MIQSNELRIGNALLYPKYWRDKTDKVWFVRDLYFENERVGLTDYKIQTSVLLKELQPIPLSEEVLLKCGADKKHFVEWHGNGYDYQPENSKTIQQDYVLGNIIIRFETFVFNKEETTEILIGVIGDWYERITFDNILLYELQGLHHLQNIVKDLTNQELTINL